MHIRAVHELTVSTLLLLCNVIGILTPLNPFITFMTAFCHNFFCLQYCTLFLLLVTCLYVKHIQRPGRALADALSCRCYQRHGQ